MNLLIEKKYSAAVEAFKQHILLLEVEKKQHIQVQEEEKKETHSHTCTVATSSTSMTEMDTNMMTLTLDNTIAILYCNIAIAENGMGLYRKCIKSCAMAMKHDPTNIKAYLIEGKAYMSIGKAGHAQATWKEGMDKFTDFCDAETALQIVESLASLTKPVDPVTNSNDSIDIVTVNKNVDMPPPVPPSSKPPAAPEAALKSSSTLPPTPPTVEVTVEPTPKHQTCSGGPAQAIAALGGKQRKVGIEQLKIIENHFIGFSPNQIHPDIIKAASQSVANACGESTVDNLISMGYLLVNNNKLAEACELFTTLLQYRLDLKAAYLGLGSCWALTGRLDEATQAFTSAIKLDPKCADAWKRRGQTNAAADRVDEGLSDLKQAQRLGSDHDILYHLGSTYHQKKHFKAALDCFNLYQKNGGAESGKMYNYLGMCNSQLGNVTQALEYFAQAISLEPELVEATINRAQMLKEAGRGKEADDAFETAIRWFNSNRKPPESIGGSSDRVDMSRHVFQYRATLQYSMGNYMEALGYLRRYLGDECESLDDPLKKTERVNALVQSALCLQNLGQYSEALVFFENATHLMPESTCRVQKHILLYYLHQADYSLDEFCVDADFNEQWKEAFCKYDNIVARHQSPFVIGDCNADGDEDIVEELDSSYEVGPELCRIVEISRGLSHLIQLDTPGFLPNSRQQKSFGLAALQMAKRLSQHCDLILEHSDGMLAGEIHEEVDVSADASCQYGLKVLNCGASGRSESRVGSTDDDESDQGAHIFMYRDFFDIVVKWRQISEPNDPVWWIDRLTKKSFHDGFGLHTPMVNGELKCIRYYPYFDMGFALMKKLLTAPGGVYFIARGEHKMSLSENKKQVIRCASSLDDVYEIIGEDFWVVCPCMSSINNEALLEGTRLTLCKKISDVGEVGVGYDFSIRTPGLPSRWAAMDSELTACFNAIVKQLVLLKRMEMMDVATPNSETLKRVAEAQVLRESLRLFYYWVNFAPLTRGSAMCGYAAVLAVIIASNKTITSLIPPGKQLDWEAIFTSTPSEFIKKFEKEIHTKPSDFSLSDIDFETAMPSLYDVLQTLHLA